MNDLERCLAQSRDNYVLQTEEYDSFGPLLLGYKNPFIKNSPLGVLENSVPWDITKA